MPVIFVHGVNTRTESPAYEASKQITAEFLRTYFGGASIDGRPLPADLAVAFPYWGDLATKFAWNMRSLPSGEIDALGSGAVESELRPLIVLLKDALGDSAGTSEEPLLALARVNFQLAIELLCDALIANPLKLSSDEVATAVVKAQLYASSFPVPAVPHWLHSMTSDMQLVSTVAKEIDTSAYPSINSLGSVGKIFTPLSSAAKKFRSAVAKTRTKIVDSAGDFASTRALSWCRAPLNATLGRFFGDVFIYMHGRGTRDQPGPITTCILDAWDQAIVAAPDEPVVIIAHSLGGVISFDLLSYFRPDFQVDLFVTVGSQVSHFEEMKLFLVSDPRVPNGDVTRRAKKPDNVRRWINVFDEVDIFSYACERIFEDVQDLHYDTRTYVLKAHSAYFMQPRFYQRLRARIDGVQR